MSARVAADGDGIVATGAVDTDRIADAVLRFADDPADDDGHLGTGGST